MFIDPRLGRTRKLRQERHGNVRYCRSRSNLPVVIRSLWLPPSALVSNQLFRLDRLENAALIVRDLESV